MLFVLEKGKPKLVMTPYNTRQMSTDRSLKMPHENIIEIMDKTAT